ncbi:hypothetical protein SAMN04487969_1555 [Paenibacillus algorifonticola]|uniref:Uncharacterized protein n=1 Tax=Paenibacillus algorifonticola TaxID=684063 RepID=A0A1I2J4M4_9BACL|nr:hypothetical protein [Paenibacillus algorifonticola]SFF49339.1 hypothetical protein SAMN04487969_1555 [Paenibacillus algorifonticola]
MSNYKMMQVYTGVKTVVQDLKKELELKSESETVAYLAAIRELHKDKLTHVQHQEAIKRMHEIINQSSM